MYCSLDFLLILTLKVNAYPCIEALRISCWTPTRTCFPTRVETPTALWARARRCSIHLKWSIRLIFWAAAAWALPVKYCIAVVVIVVIIAVVKLGTLAVFLLLIVSGNLKLHKMTDKKSKHTSMMFTASDWLKPKTKNGNHLHHKEHEIFSWTQKGWWFCLPLVLVEV